MKRRAYGRDTGLTLRLLATSGLLGLLYVGFAVFTVASILLAVTWQTGDAAAWWLIIWRIVQGVGGAFGLLDQLVGEATTRLAGREDLRHRDGVGERAELGAADHRHRHRPRALPARAQHAEPIAGRDDERHARRHLAHASGRR